MSSLLSNVARRWPLLLLALLLAGLAALAARPTPTLVDLAEVDRGPLTVTVDDDGRTRVAERFRVHAPVRGRLLRPRLEEGDAVAAGTTPIVELDPTDPTPLDARVRAEAFARLERARARLEEATLAIERARAEEVYAADRLERLRGLAVGVESEDERARAERDLSRAVTERRAARAAETTARLEVELARATLAPYDLATDDAADPADGAGGEGPAPPIVVRSPIDGVVLDLFVESARPVEAGEPLLELGDLRGLEIVADFLTEQAVRVAPGQRVRVDGWGAPDAPALEGRVRRVEPAGRTVVSALGVEEQRVDVVIDLLDPPDSRPPLGDGFRVRCEIVLEEVPEAVRVPLGALLREADGWLTFVDDGGTAREVAVEVGRTDGLHAEVLAGLAPGDRVVLYPSERVTDGTPIATRDDLR